MCLSSMARRKRAGIDIDELIAAQDAADVGIIEDVLGSGQAQRRSGDHHRGAVGDAILAVVDLVAAIENIGEQTAEFVVAIAVRRHGWSEEPGDPEAPAALPLQGLVRKLPPECETAGTEGSRNASAVPRPNPAA